MSIFSNFYAFIEAQFGALTPLMLIGGAGLIIIMCALPFLLIKPAEPFDKVKSQRVGSEERVGRKGAGAAAAALRREEKVDKLQRFASFLEPQTSGEMDAARMQMVRAGYRGKHAVRMYHFLQLLLGVAGLILGGGYSLLKSMTTEMPTQGMMLYVLGSGLVGFYLPKYLVTRAVQKRQAEIISGFPDALDLLLVSVEAGQSLDQSITRIAKETRASYPALADELDIVSQEVKAGKERSGVLKEMALRVDVPDITSFVSTLVQSSTFGTPIADALRLYSAEMRDKRTSRAEEIANKVPSKMTLGSMIFTMPPLLVILVGPMLFQFAS